MAGKTALLRLQLLRPTPRASVRSLTAGVVVVIGAAVMASFVAEVDVVATSVGVAMVISAAAVAALVAIVAREESTEVVVVDAAAHVAVHKLQLPALREMLVGKETFEQPDTVRE